jgi:xanthine dehydrogenase accessory factor
MVSGILEAVAGLLEEERLGALATVIDGPHRGQRALISGEGEILSGELSETVASAVIADALTLMSNEQSRTLSFDDEQVFIETLAPPPHLVVWGADEVAITLTEMAGRVGFRSTVCDPRPAFAVADRFPAADRVLAGWPGDLADRLDFDGRTYVVVLTHDDRVEGPLLPLVLASPARYIGALGSRRTHRKRCERLLAEGWGEADVERIHGPVGLDIGAETAAEVAVSILAEMIAARYASGSGEPLVGREGRIHVQRGDE